MSAAGAPPLEAARKISIGDAPDCCVYTIVLPSRVNCMSSSSLSPLAPTRTAPPVTGIIWMPCRPRSLVVKNRFAESGDQVKLFTQRSIVSVRLVTWPVARSSTISRQRSLS